MDEKQKQLEQYVKALIEKYAEDLKQDIKSKLSETTRKIYTEDDYISYQFKPSNYNVDEKPEVYSNFMFVESKNDQSSTTNNILRENLLKTSQMFYDDYNDLDQYEIKSKLKEYLDERGMTQTWLCDKTGISRSTMVMILKKPESSNLLNIHKIAKVLGVPIEQIFPFEEIDNTLTD